MPAHRFALLKFDPEILNQLSLIAERLCRLNFAAHPGSFRHCEIFLSRHIGIKDHAALRFFTAAFPEMTLGQLHNKICAFLILKMQRRKPLAVQPVVALRQLPVMFFPQRDRILLILNPDRSQDRIPQLFHRGIRLFLRKDFQRPFRIWNCDDRPLTEIGHRVVLEFFQCFAARGDDLLDLLLIDILHDARDARVNMQYAVSAVDKFLFPRHQPVWNPLQHRRFRVLIVQLGDLIIEPLHDDLTRSGTIAFFDAHSDKRR